MKNSGFKRKEWERIPKDERPIAKSSIAPLHKGVYAPVTSSATVAPKSTKVSKVRSLTAPGRGESAITKSARGEECQMRLPGVCLYLPEYTIWSHARWNDAGRGKSIKAPDVCGAYTCTACDAVYDGQAKRPAGMTQSDVDHEWLRAHMRSLLRAAQKGLI